MNNNQIRKRIKELESLARPLTPGPDERQRLFSTVANFGENFISESKDGPATARENIDVKETQAFSYSELPGDLDQILEQLEHDIVSQGISTTSGRFFGFIPGGGLFSSALGDYLSALTNVYAGHRFGSLGATRCERSLVRWFAESIGYPAAVEGDLTSGGSIANLSAIITAREAAELKANDYQQCVVYLTSITHHCTTKALRIAGMSECQLRIIQMDDIYRMDTAELSKAISKDRASGLKPWLIIGTAGTTDLGTIDPLSELADISEQEGLWFHVDAAYGGAFALCDEGRRRLQGLERSDSMIVDPHKGLFLPYGTGMVIVANGSKLLEAYQDSAPYMQDIHTEQSKDTLSASDLSPELSRHFRGLRLWMALKLHGVAAFRAALEEKLLLAEYFHTRLAEIDGFDFGPYPQLSIAAFRYLPKYGDANTFNQKLCDELRNDGRIFLSSTTIKNYYVLRFAVLSYNTHIDDVDEAIDLIVAKAKQLQE